MCLTVYKLCTDGACWGNPGKASAGIAIYDQHDKEIFKGAVYLGEATNNIAEYAAVYEGLKIAGNLGVDKLKVYSDSLLVIKQLNNEYKVNSSKLCELKEKIDGLRGNFKYVEFIHVKRDLSEAPHKLAESILKIN